MAITNQDFILYAGDISSPVFLVKDSAGNAVNISTVTDIDWYCRRNLEEPIALTKSKSGGTISFVTTGADGKFQVSITSTDTTTLTGNYLHLASLTDGLGNVTTTTVGTMQVGPAPSWTYDPGTVGTIALNTVRYLIGDTIRTDQQLYDQEIKFAINNYSNVYLASAVCARAIAAKYARQVDTVQGELRTMYSERTKRYLIMADGPNGLWQQGMARGGVFAYAGGISVTDKQQAEEDTDRISPQFTIGEFDNFLPVGPVGHETLDQAATNQAENA